MQFLNPFESSDGSPAGPRFDVLAEILEKHPNTWMIISKEETPPKAKAVCLGLRRRKCLARYRLRSDGYYYVFGCAWRFNYEGT